MALPLPFRRFHLFEINDEPWFPTILRRNVQDVLTEVWTTQTEPFQMASPASFVVRVLRDVLVSRLHLYTFIDLCSGAGGPTPYVESEINRQDEGVDFILTDLHPHVLAWQTASKASRSGNLRYISTPVDASSVTKELWSLAQPPKENLTAEEPKIFRLFNLAFHHFDDELAIKILEDTLRTSDGFGVFELQGRDVGNILNVLSLFPILYLGSWWWYWGEWSLLFWNGVIPVVPFVVTFDGVVSCLRTRSEKEMSDLLQRASANIEGGLSSWRFEAGLEKHTRLLGTMTYFVGVKA